MESLFSTMIFLLLVSLSCSTSSEALSSNYGNVTIKWDLMAFTPDGYVATVTAYNHQAQRSISGWVMRWRWTKKEVIWNMIGAQTTDHGECSMFKGIAPQSCVRDPKVIDMLPDTPYNHQVANCCKSGVLTPGSESTFQLCVGNAGTSVKTVRIPVNFTLEASNQQYICGPTENVRPTRFVSADKRRTLTAKMTWNVTCVFKKSSMSKRRFQAE